jgi:hypothetical protein
LEENVQDIEWILCGHVFHKECLDAGKEKQRDGSVVDTLRMCCPVCRASRTTLLENEMKLLEEDKIDRPKVQKRKLSDLDDALPDLDDDDDMSHDYIIQVLTKHLERYQRFIFRLKHQHY